MTKNSTCPSHLKLKPLPVAALLLLLLGGPVAAADAPAAPANAEPLATNTLTEEDAPKKPMMVEAQISEVAGSQHTAGEKAAELFKIFTQLDPQGQRKVALAAVSQVDDAHYALIGKYLLDPKLDPRVLSVFMTDTLKRPNSVRLPLLLELAQMNGHPLQAESRELLTALLQKNYGTNWTKWQEAVTAQLAEPSK
jgi:hypothetical protein